jgi:hypothetical protein
MKMVASIVKSPSAHSIFPAQIEDHRVIGLNSRPRLYHEIATGPSAWSSGEPKSSETGLPGATTAATRGRATQLVPCGTSDIRTCSNDCDCDTVTHEHLGIHTGWHIEWRMCETAGSERGAALTRQASPFARRTEKRVGHDLPSLCATEYHHVL